MQYHIQGEPMPVVICELAANESMITERGSMVWMSPNMRMETISGGVGKALGRIFSGEALFQNVFTAQGGPGMIAFASSFPGAIRAVEISPERPVIAQKSAFLAATRGRGLLTHRLDHSAPCRDAEAVIAAANYNPLADDTPDSVFCAHGAGYTVPWDQVRAHAHCPVDDA